MNQQNLSNQAEPPLCVPLSDAWKEKWRVLDDSFEAVAKAISEEGGKPIGSAIIELVKAKFPFNEHSEFPI